MSLYVHIPFCHSKCAYCGFYSVASNTMRKDWLSSLCREIISRKEELGPGIIHETLYFGGGTPSMLSSEEWYTIMECIAKNYHLSPLAERTLEANPEDLTSANATLWKQLGFNRLSIGIQSLNDNALKASNRRHTAEEAQRAIEIASHAGFENLSVDFIVGLPNSDKSDLVLASNLLKAWPINHVSLYILSLDEGSVLYKKKQLGTFTPLPEEQEVELFQNYCHMIKESGFEHYEISNFAKPGFRSRHNSAYWEQKAYLGFGPAAHSYNGDRCRRWNIANIKQYCQAWLPDDLSPNRSYEEEILDPKDLYNELIMTRLRTIHGIPLMLLQKECFKTYWESGRKAVQKYIDYGVAKMDHETLSLTEEGWLISDRIFTDLFY